DRGAASRLRAKQSEVPERREPQSAALGKQRLGEVIVVMPSKRDEQGVLRKVGLHQYFPTQFPASCPPRDLFEQRKQTLGGAKVCAVERVVCTENADQRQPRKIVTFGEHLGANQDVDVAGNDRLSHRCECPSAAGAVAI